MIAVAALVTVTLSAAALARAFRHGEDVPPGVPLLRRLGAADAGAELLLAPHRPGWNLVRIDTGAAPGPGRTGNGVDVGTDRDRLRPATPRPGANGRWALVWLPSGRTTLWVRYGTRRTAVTLDTGGRSAAPDLTGPDGPECLSAMLGTLAAGSRVPLRTCPSQTLIAADAAALRATVRFVAGRGHRHVDLVSDGSPRSSAAARIVREEAARTGLSTGAAGPAGRVTARRPAVVVSGWATAATTLGDIAVNRLRGIEGAYLAPWLMHAPVLAAPVGGLVALRYSPTEPLALAYLAALSRVVDGEPPSESGYTTWLAALRRRQLGPVRLYAATHVTIPGLGLGPGPGHAHSAGWLPQGTVTAVTGPLTAG